MVLAGGSVSALDKTFQAETIPPTLERKVRGMQESKSLRKHVVAAIGPRQEIEQIVGQDAFAKLVERYGGSRLYVPHTLPPAHPLCQLVGSDTAGKLTADFGGLSIDIPRALAAQIERRNDSILAERSGGITVRKLAFKYRLTERTIRKIINGN